MKKKLDNNGPFLSFCKFVIAIDFEATFCLLRSEARPRSIETNKELADGKS